MFKKGIGMMAAALSLALVVTGCGGGAAQPEPAAEPAKQETSYTVKHSMGEQTFTATPQKVVTLTGEATEAALAMGVKPVGAVKSWTGDPFYPHIAKDLEGVKVVGDEGQPNLEAIAALQPDLIIANKLRHEKIYEQLKAIAPTVVSETLRGEWKNNFKLYSETLNKKAEGDKVMADWDKRVADLKGKYGEKFASTKVSTVRFMAGKTRIYYTQTFSGVIFKELGIARPENQMKDAFADEVTKEAIPQFDGDIMFYFTYETGKGDATKQEEAFVNDPLFKNLNAVKNGKAYKVDDVIWNTAGGVKAAFLLLDDIEKHFSK
jgi:iron complex transport system substrate-binding protein